MKIWLGGLGVAGALLLSVPQPAIAAPTAGCVAAVRQQVESSMLVGGDIHIETDGSVLALQLR
ncbi:MAG: hypothetical protein ACN6RK_01990 [Stenotrophomonas sp.]